jgi:site-specific recombinase XerD
VKGVFGREKIIEIAKSIPSLYPKSYPYKERDRALFCFLYLTGARVDEIVEGKKKVGVKKKDLELAKINKKDFLVVSLYTLKNRKHPIRRVPIPIKREGILVKYVLDYVEKLDSEQYLFPFTKQRAWQIIRSILEKYKKNKKNKFMNANHFLRHCRLTHLVTIYDFTDQDLVQFTGWSSSLPATIYSHLRFKDLARKMA